MKCNYCGAEFEGNFCPECGAKTENETTTPPPVQEQKDETNYQQSMQGTPIKPAKKKKPFYLRWWFIAIVVLVIGSVAMSIGKGGKNGGANKGKYEIPNVFGVNYEEAIDILEAEDFEVKAVATSVKGISDKLLYPLENVEKDTVFKIDDYILDNLGNITVNYDVFDAVDSMTTNKKSIVIYYAKETYIKEKEVSTSEQENESAGNTETSEDLETSSNTNTDTTTNTSKKTNSGGLRSDFKTAMDSYEKFFDEYVAIMKKYANNPTDTSILADYSKYMGKYAQMMSDFEKWESEDMNDAELAYYLEVQGRITKKLLEVSQ